MQTIRALIDFLLLLYLLVLFGRMVLDWIQVFSRQWRPRGPMLVVAEAVYTLTDPPLKALRRILPPLRIGGVALDLGFLVLVIAISVLRAII